MSLTFSRASAPPSHRRCQVGHFEEQTRRDGPDQGLLHQLSEARITGHDGGNHGVLDQGDGKEEGRAYGQALIGKGEKDDRQAGVSGIRQGERRQECSLGQAEQQKRSKGQSPAAKDRADRDCDDPRERFIGKGGACQRGEHEGGGAYEHCQSAERFGLESDAPVLEEKPDPGDDKNRRDDLKNLG